LGQGRAVPRLRAYRSLPRGPSLLRRAASVSTNYSGPERVTCFMFSPALAATTTASFAWRQIGDGREAAVRAQSRDDIRAMIATYPEHDEILFTSGEPTLNPDLAGVRGLAKEKGFRRDRLITNGRRLAYPSFLASLLEAGVNRITVSIHGHNAALHDSLTRTPGSFEHTHAALQSWRA